MKIIQKEFLFHEPLPTPECHASTLVRLENGDIVAAWFGGTKEGRPDVRIHYSRRENGVWSAPCSIPSDTDVQHWNPVLFSTAADTLQLFYKKGYPIAAWQTMTAVSADGGRTWSEPRELVPDDTSGGRGPVKNKPLFLADGTLIAPASTEQGKWRCFIDRFDGAAWHKHPIPVSAEEEEALGLIQPTLWESKPGHVHALMRSNMGQIYRSDSADNAASWCTAYPIGLPNNNSGLDCVNTPVGLVLVCNPVEKNWGARSPLSVFLSADNGSTFQKMFDLETEEGEFSYPAVICSGERIHITYTYRRRQIVYCEAAL